MRAKRLFGLFSAVLLLLVLHGGSAMAQYKCTGDWILNQMKRCCTQKWGCLCYPSGQFSSTPCDRDEPRLSPREQTADNLRDLIKQFQGDSRMTDYLIKDLDGVIRKLNGEKPSAEAGRFFSRMAGAGTCTRHFYNNSNDWWGLGMYYAGTCEGDAVPDSPMGDNHYACLIPPHSSTVIHFANFGDEPNGGQIAIAGLFYRRIFDLRLVGCHIDHQGNTGQATLNDPADGDIAVR